MGQMLKWCGKRGKNNLPETAADRPLTGVSAPASPQVPGDGRAGFQRGWEDVGAQKLGWLHLCACWGIRKIVDSPPNLQHIQTTTLPAPPYNDEEDTNAPCLDDSRANADDAPCRESGN